MNREEIIYKCEEFVKKYLDDVESGHNWLHINRVLNNARKIYREELRGDPFIIDLAAMLHDIGDDKIDRETDGPAIVTEFLGKTGVSNSVTTRVVHIIRHISFRDSFSGSAERTAELDIVQDADRLDAIGAIGIARAFSYGGSVGSEIYIPGEAAANLKSKEEYISSRSSTINHFYEKLLKLKGMMNTDAGRKMADERHKFMELFLDQFYREVSI